MKTALLRALAAHAARVNAAPNLRWVSPRVAKEIARVHGLIPDDAPDSRRGMCGADCGGSPCSREAGHRDRCDPEGTDPSPLRFAVRRALDAPTGPTQAALARAAGIAPENLSAWLKGRRPIPVRAIEAMLAQLDLVIVPRS